MANQIAWEIVIYGEIIYAFYIIADEENNGHDKVWLEHIKK